MSTDPESRTGFGPYLPLVGPTYDDNGKQRTIRFGEISDIENDFKLHGKNIAAFLIEPIQGEAGYVSVAVSSFALPHTQCSGLWFLPKVTSRLSVNCVTSTTFS